MTYTVDIGIACSTSQYPEWWAPLFGKLLQEQQRGIVFGQILAPKSAVPDHNKNNIIGAQIGSEEGKKRNDLTDANRQAISKGFMGGSLVHKVKSDWLFMIDDDVVFPDGTLTHLLSLDKIFVAGLYFNPKKPYNPIAYMRYENGLYASIHGYPKGALYPVDSVGMGCTLIHRSVFEKILDEYVIYMRPNASLAPVHKGAIWNENKRHKGSLDNFVDGGYLHTKVTRPDADDDRMFPFFALEYGRTEDHHFCELAAGVGIRPWVDTNVVCGHWKPQETTEADYKQEELKREGIDPGQ